MYRNITNNMFCVSGGFRILFMAGVMLIIKFFRYLDTCHEQLRAKNKFNIFFGNNLRLIRLGST